MHKFVLSLFAILLLASCSHDEGGVVQEEGPGQEAPVSHRDTNSTDPIEEEVDQREPIFEMVRVNAPNLRLREAPTLGAPVLRLTSEDTVLEVVDRADVKEEIGGIEDYWYEVSFPGSFGPLTGWLFGGYLDEYTKQTPDQTILIDGELIEVESFEQKSMSFFGGIDPPYVLPTVEERILYDSLQRTLFFVEPAEAVDSEFIRVTATAPDNRAFSQVFGDAFPGLSRITYDERNGVDLNYTVLGFGFYAAASFPAGVWEFTVEYDNGFVNDYTLEMPASGFCFSAVKDPDPFNYTSSTSVAPGDRLYLYGNRDSKDAPTSVVIYRMVWGENPSPDLEPALATMVDPSDTEGFELAFIVGNDLPEGEYKVGFGSDEITVIEWNVGFTVRTP